MSWKAIVVTILGLEALVACSSQSPVEWSDLSVDGGGVADSNLTRDHHAVGICESSFRMLGGRGVGDGKGRVTAWWRPRSDSSVVLEAGYSSDEGRTWRTVSVDTVDRTRTGCDRPAPAIAAERDNVHIVYSLHGPEGTGVFYAHSMDRGATFHAPVSIVYGDRLTEASVDAQGDRVLIAYVDPNTEPPQIGLAISTTQGHNFLPRISASEGTGIKTHPTISLTRDDLVVGWLQRPSADSSRTMPVKRIGHLR